MIQQIDSSNRFGVRAANDARTKLRIYRLPVEGWPAPLASELLSREEALNLAAWLVAIADPTAAEYEQLLALVRSDVP